MLLGILRHIPDTGEAYAIVKQLVATLAPGSFVAINHSTSAIHGAAMEEAVARWNKVGTPSMTLRTPQQIAALSPGWTSSPACGQRLCTRPCASPGNRIHLRLRTTVGCCSS
jgi:S-adenosyl methyltransferase